jgi:ParE toxin of type II toxin-antitoxin system, parDE
MDYSFHPLADKEVDQIIDYYDSLEDFPLGDDFLIELRNALVRITTFPDAWQKVWPSARRCLLARFPYQLVYQKRPDGILIVAVMHLHREPNYWKDRI